MISKYEIGDTVLLPATITGIEQFENGEIFYRIRGYNLPVKEETILGRIESGWKLQKQITSDD